MLYNKINLQLFATVQTTLLEGLSAEMKTFYDMTLIDEASANLVHDQFGQKRPIPANGGKTIEFRKFSSLPKATTPITEGATPDGKSLTVTAITATVAQYGDYPPAEVHSRLDAAPQRSAPGLPVPSPLRPLYGSLPPSGTPQVL